MLEPPKNPKCDGCGRRFKATPHVNKLDGGGEEWTLRCPHCGRVYPIVRITGKGVELRTKMKRLRGRGLGVEQELALLEQFQKEVTRLT